MIKRLIGLCLAAMMLFGAANALAQSQPEWEYPLAPEILKDPGDYIILTNTETLLGADYIPDDLVRVTAKKGAGGEMELRKAANDALNAMFADDAPKKKFACKICGWIYEGDTLPEDIVCPLCKHGAADFEPLA